MYFRLNLALQVIPLNDNQGYYKEDIGKALILENYHTLYIPFNLSYIKFAISQLYTNQIILSHIIQDSKDNSLFELLNVSTEKLNNTYDEYEKLYEKPSRKKRGLINLLGSGIKFVTGNLDNTDLINIDSQMEILKLNQLKEVKRINELSSFAGTTANKLKNIVISINENSKRIQKKISNLEEKIKILILLQNHILQITKLNDMLKLWERTISFAHSSTLNIELFSLNEITEIWQYLHFNYITKTIFPLEHLSDLTALCPAGFMIYKELAVVIIKVPIFDLRLCNLSFIYPIPNNDDQLLLVPSRYYCNSTWYRNCKQVLAHWICQNILPDNCTLQNHCTGITAQNNYQTYQLTEKKNLLVCTKQEENIYENCQQFTQEKIRGCSLLYSPCELIINGRKFYSESVWIEPIQSTEKVTIINSDLHLNFKTSHLERPEEIKEDAFPPLEMTPIITKAHTASHTLLWILLIAIIVSLLVIWRKKRTFLTRKKLEAIVNEDVSTKDGGIISLECPLECH